MKKVYALGMRPVPFCAWTKLSSRPRWLTMGVLTLALLSGSAGAQKKGPVLHEPIPDDAEDDQNKGVPITTKASIHTPSGMVPISVSRDSTPATPPSFEGSFVPDRDARAPEMMPSSEVFTPSVTPYKRLSVFDAIAKDWTLAVAKPSLFEIPMRGPTSAEIEAYGAWDSFRGELALRANAGSPTRIPSVAPSSLVTQATLYVQGEVATIRFYRDGAENWFFQTNKSGEARLSYTLAAPRAAFGGAFWRKSVGWSDLAVPSIPANVRTSANNVLRALGLSRETSTPAAALDRLVAYFRSFQDSSEALGDHGDIYQDLALSKKGVCRHRSYAFVITALALGLPSRLVINEEHAWVEVHNGLLWKRIDLGGAGRLAIEPKGTVASYTAPEEPFRWPQGSTSGEQARREARAAAEKSAAENKYAVPSPTRALSSAKPIGSTRMGARDPNETAWSGKSTLRVASTERTTYRGKELLVSGEFLSNKSDCKNVSIFLSLQRKGPAPQAYAVGTLLSDGEGRFSGSVLVPPSVEVGDYTLYARTNGSESCPPGESTPKERAP